MCAPASHRLTLAISRSAPALLEAAVVELTSRLARLALAMLAMSVLRQGAQPRVVVAHCLCRRARARAVEMYSCWQALARRRRAARFAWAVALVLRRAVARSSFDRLMVAPQVAAARCRLAVVPLRVVTLARYR